MTTEKLPVKVMLTIIEATDPQDVPNKTYKKMSVKATTDKTGDSIYVFETFYPSVFRAVKYNIGKSIECYVLLDERKIVSIVEDEELKEKSIQAQTAVKAVADMSLSESVKLPDDILDQTFSIIRKWYDGVLK